MKPHPISHQRLIRIGLLFLVFTNSNFAFGRTDLQERLAQRRTHRSELVKRYGLTRLWTFEDRYKIEDDVALGNLGDGESWVHSAMLINRNHSVKPRTCARNTFAYFDQGMIESDESLLIEDVLNDVKPTSLESNLETTGKIWRELKRLYPNWVPANRIDPAPINSRIAETLAKRTTGKSIGNSTSLIEVKGNKVNSSDYTIGGWFKPGSLNSNELKPMTLFTKKLIGGQGEAAIVEWKIFVSGNVLYFHNYRDEAPTTAKYLTPVDASQFRNDHAEFYGRSDYFADAVANANAVALSRASSQSRFTILDEPALPREKKPVSPPRPPPIFIPPPPYEPPPPEIPVPFPPFPAPRPIPGGSGKEYTSNFDMKHFWWAAQLGSCYGCESRSQHRDAWYYVAISVHLNDPLGPYVDLTMILDANEKIFGPNATMQRNVKTARWELNSAMLSRQPYNPIEHTARLEKGCAGGNSCVRSVLEIGSIDQNTGYTGFMRGIYIAKKALGSDAVLDLAAQFYPNDTEQCTYRDQRR